MSDDDLTRFTDEPVFRALTEPASAAELAGETEALAAFRASVPRRPHRRFAARLGAGGSVFIAAAALSGGVAAASYTGALPEPAQHVMNEVAGWAGIPAPTHHHHHGRISAGGTATPVATGTVGGTTGLAGPGPSPAVAPSSSPTSHAGKAGGTIGVTAPRGSPTATTGVSPSPTASPTPSATPTPNPTPTVVAPVPAALTVSVNAVRVPANSGVTLSGQLTTSSGEPVPGHRIVVFERPAGGGRFSPLGSASTDADGQVSFGVPPLTHSVRLVLRAGGHVHSSVVSVVEVPTVSVAVTPASTTDTIAVSTNGAAAGDEVVLMVRQHRTWSQLDAAQLDTSGAWSVSVPAPVGRAARYRVVLKRTAGHAAASAGFRIPPG